VIILVVVPSNRRITPRKGVNKPQFERRHTYTMFNSTVKMSFINSAQMILALIDGPTNRRTLRSNADGGLKFSVAHQESNENPGFTTSRSNLRLSQTFDVPDTEKQVNAYVQLTFSFPRGTPVISADIQSLLAALINFLVYPDTTTSSAPYQVKLVNTDLVAIPRLIGQES